MKLPMGESIARARAALSEAIQLCNVVALRGKVRR